MQSIDKKPAKQATKDAQQDNQKLCADEDESKKLIGRKLDLIIAESGVALSSSEWKESQTTPVCIQQVLLPLVDIFYHVKVMFLTIN